MGMEDLHSLRWLSCVASGKGENPFHLDRNQKYDLVWDARPDSFLGRNRIKYCTGNTENYFEIPLGLLRQYFGKKNQKFFVSSCCLTHCDTNHLSVKLRAKKAQDLLEEDTCETKQNKN